MVIEVVPRPTRMGLDDWAYLFEDLYESDDPLVGWIDGFTGVAVPEVQMREWVAATVGRLETLPVRRVLEVGAGSGLVMREVLRLPGVEHYVASDVADTSVLRLRELAAVEGRESTVHVLRAAAHDVGELVTGTFDLAVLNSVVQYFPDVAYLVEILRALARKIVPGGHIFVGDVRDPLHLPALYRERARSRGRGAVLSEQRLDHELAVSADFADDLPRLVDRVTAAEVSPRRGVTPTEMTRYRYDVLLHVGCRVPPLPNPVVEGARDMDTVVERLAVDVEGAVVNTFDSSRFGRFPTAVDPEHLWRTATELGQVWWIGRQPGRDMSVLTASRQPAAGAHFCLSWPRMQARGPYAQPPLPAATAAALREELAVEASLVGGQPVTVDLVWHPRMEQ
ncbi:class I SAM-dependent methyltransferase [Branchiibius hedensis]|nr:class I SAM-dependent methyltransferase [Branchiibius hedensis]